jgi:hypothetical protein
MSMESGIYKYRLIIEAKIPLRINDADADMVYKLIHALLTLRVDII